MPRILNQYVSEDENAVLEAMSVIPIYSLTAEDIAGEMFLKDVYGRQVIPILKVLLKKGLVIREESPRKGRAIKWRLSPAVEESVEKKWATHHPELVE